MFSSFRSTLRTRAALVAGGTAVVLAVGGGATAAFAATGDSTPAPTTSTSCTVHLGAILRGGESKQLRADFKTLRGESKTDRAKERAAIRTKALDGEYGARVERLAHIVAGTTASKGHGWASTLPTSLKADLKTLRGMTAKSSERKAEAQKIVQKALAGDYGTTIKTRAEQVQQHVQARCAAKG